MWSLSTSRGSVALVALLAVGVPAVRADEPPAPPGEEKPAEEKAESSEVGEERVPTDEEARAIAEVLKGAAKKKTAEALDAIAKVKGLVHKEFLKPLQKLLGHDATEVALAAAKALVRQKPRGTDPKQVAKDAAKALSDLGKYGWMLPANDKRPVVKGALASLWGAWGVLLDEPLVEDVERVWRLMEGNPRPEFSPVFLDFIAYAHATKDKRLSKHLALLLEGPQPANVNAANNPPESYWKARWEMWEPTEKPARKALEQMTGQKFKTIADAKAWFEANERAYGFKW